MARNICIVIPSMFEFVFHHNVCLKLSNSETSLSSAFTKCTFTSKENTTFSLWENVTAPLEVLRNASCEEDYNLFFSFTPWNRVVTLGNGNLFSTGGPDDKMGGIRWSILGQRGWMTGG